ncbi:hypothetical protein ACFONN_13410 [Dyella humi]|uniref:Uncharacterized protein n=1 Tax=Dyella humi TaxID=1770547 RepID=A0ABW8ILA8_9GAMM
MRSPWVDLLFLHGYITTPSAALAWRPDAPPCGCEQKPVEVNVTQLPLPVDPHDESTCCA